VRDDYVCTARVWVSPVQAPDTPDRVGGWVSVASVSAWVRACVSVSVRGCESVRERVQGQACASVGKRKTSAGHE